MAIIIKNGIEYPFGSNILLNAEGYIGGDSDEMVGGDSPAYSIIEDGAWSDGSVVATNSINAEIGAVYVLLINGPQSGIAANADIINSGAIQITSQFFDAGSTVMRAGCYLIKATDTTVNLKLNCHYYKLT